MTAQQQNSSTLGRTLRKSLRLAGPALTRVTRVANAVLEQAQQPPRRAVLNRSEQKALFQRYAPRYSEVLGLAFERQQPSHSSSDHPEYSWTTWTRTIREDFCSGVPTRFLAHPAISNTMVFQRTRGKAAASERIQLVVDAFDREVASKLLREDWVGGPNITDNTWLTSANRAHHASHLAFYRRALGRTLWSTPSILEWGGGYGGLARIIRRLNPTVTYVIADLPALLALQFVYLSSVEGIEPIIVRPGASLIPGRVNLVCSNSLTDGHVELSCDTFISTWALSESPLDLQASVIDTSLSSAKHVLLAHRKTDGNALTTACDRLALREYEVPFLGCDHRYLMS